jgi:choice-of-anchor B domain-containing protein
MAMLFLPLSESAGAHLTEVQNVRVEGNTLLWDSTPGAVQYRVTRGEASALPNYCSSRIDLTVQTSRLDTDLPASGEAFTYLVRALDSSEDGPLGTTSDGTDRSSTLACDLDGDGVGDGSDNCPLDGNTGQQDQDGDGTGDACEFPASAVSLLGRVSLREIPEDQHGANDVWHYTSPMGEEYAILGLTKGAAFVNITDPANPGVAGFIDGDGIDQPWRDMATFGQYAYIVSDGAGVGLQIADMTDIDNDNVVLANTTDLGSGFIDAHNVFVNEASGTLYLAIPNINGGLGLTAVDLNADPVNPTITSFWTDADPGVRCHDVQVVSYTTGPYNGREVAFCFAEEDGLYIVDVTDKSNMIRASKLLYDNATYAHQGWLRDDRRYLLLGDELDERDDPDVTTTTTYVIDVNDLLNPQLETTFTNGLASIDHNLMVRNDFAFEANYSSGLRVWDVSNVHSIVETGFFDTRPEDDARNFRGAWGVSALLPSGNVLISDRQRGLFVLDASLATASVDVCSEGEELDPSSHPCVSAVCAQDGYCCATGWDAGCVEAAADLCGVTCE